MVDTSVLKLVVIGAGMSGTKLISELVQRHHGYRITLLSEEPVAGYNRIMLSPVLAGEKQFSDIVNYDGPWFEEHGIELKTNCKVTQIDHANKCIISEQGEHIDYDSLVFATGSTPFIIPLPNHDATGVIGFRTKQDVDIMLSYARSNDKRRCIVIGAGLLGLEAANALRKQGADVTVLHICDSIMERQLNAAAAQLLQQHFEQSGIKFLLEVTLESIEVDEYHCVTGLKLKTGEVIGADLIVMAAGVRPNITLAKSQGIVCDKGILVDAHMATQHPDVYAIGECVQFEQHLFGLVAPTYEQAVVLADHLTGLHKAEFSVKPTATKLKVSGVDLFSAGDIQSNDTFEFLEYHDEAQKIYKRITLCDNRVVGVVMYGDVIDGVWLFDLLSQQTDVSHMRRQLLFGQHYCA